ncbi:MAG: membrane protein insertase YidC [Desulfuromonadaceae bacterium]|jgi:YidC/Oxa1 family membrane protein insertase
MENKNTLFAVFLMMAVFSIYSLFFQPAKPAAPPVATSESQQAPLVEQVDAPSAVPTVTLEQPVTGTTITPVPAGDVLPEKTFVVENDFYRAEFSSIGARLISYQLKKYRTEAALDAPLISLVDPSLFVNGTLNTAGKEAFSFPLDAHYHTDATEASTLLQDGENVSLSFTLVCSDGVKIIKNYTFYGDRYDFDLSLNVVNDSSRIVRGNLNLALFHPWNEDEKGDRFTFVGPVTLSGEGLQTDDPKDLDTALKQYGQDATWSGFENKYFISVVVPEKAAFEKILIEKSKAVITNTFNSPEISLNPGETIGLNYKLYFGPRDLDVLKGVNHNLDQAIDFGFFSPIAKPLLHVLNFFYTFLGNYGFCIILLTVILKLLFWPLTQKSYASMKAMQKLQPEMQKIREKFKNDREKMNLQLMELYKTHRVNPMGGCLPMIVQIPVFFALYKVLLDAIELRQAPFIFWLTDLSLKDPYYVTPLVMGATMFIQQKLTPSTMDPNQAKMFMIMPVVFTFLFLNFPSGLVIYWLVNNLLTILQQYFIHKKA